MQNREVPSLESLAVKAIYTSLLQMSTRESSMLYEEKVEYIRNQLDCFLPGVLGDKYRPMLIDMFQNTVKNVTRRRKRDSTNEECPDIWMFLDWALTDEFLNLHTLISKPKGKPNPLVTTTIATRSPKLEELRLSFQNSLLVDTSFLRYLVLALQPLTQLRELTLSYIDGFEPALRFVGQACPNLTSLKIFGVSCTKEAVLYIVLGEKMDGLMSSDSIWFQDDVLPSLQVPVNYRSRICSTLQQLAVLGKQGTSVEEIAAFVLVNIPNLQAVNIGEGTHAIDSAINLIRNGVLPPNLHLIYNSFLKACEAAAARIHNRACASIPLIAPPSFSGPLLLTRLDSVSLRHPQTLQSIGATCPFLRRVTFVESMPIFRLPHLSYMVPYQLVPILSTWPALESVTFKEVSISERIEDVLSVFGEGLRELTFKSCIQIKLQYLVPCTNLETLRFLVYKNQTSNLNTEGVDLHTFDPQLFLPCLKTLVSKICLREFSNFFERKSTLTDLHLDCCHVGILTGTSRSEWIEVAEMWPLLDSLHIRQCTAVPLATELPWVILQLTKLKTLHLPNWIILDQDPGFLNRTTETVRRVCGTTRPKIEVSFKPFRIRANKCRILEEVRDFYTVDRASSQQDTLAHTILKISI